RQRSARCPPCPLEGIGVFPEADATTSPTAVTTTTTGRFTGTAYGSLASLAARRGATAGDADTSRPPPQRPHSREDVSSSTSSCWASCRRYAAEGYRRLQPG